MDLNIFEKLKEIYNGIRKGIWWLVPISGFFFFVKWFWFTWLPARAKQLIAWVLNGIPAANIDTATVNIAWDRVNQWVPLNEALALGAIYLTLAGMLTLIKWTRKRLPF